MAVWVAEIDALAAALPLHFAFDRDLVLAQVLLPKFSILDRNGECNVKLSAAVMPRNGSTANGCGSDRRAPGKQQQHLSVSSLQGTKTLVASQSSELHDPLVEANGALKVSNVQGCFQDSV
jgi:hypothetical protein